MKQANLTRQLNLVCVKAKEFSLMLGMVCAVLGSVDI